MAIYRLESEGLNSQESEGLRSGKRLSLNRAYGKSYRTNFVTIPRDGCREHLGIVLA